MSTDKRATKVTTKSFKRAGIFPASEFASVLPKVVKTAWRDIAALSARKGYAGYMNLSSLCGCKVKMVSHM